MGGHDGSVLRSLIAGDWFAAAQGMARAGPERCARYARGAEAGPVAKVCVWFHVKRKPARAEPGGRVDVMNHQNQRSRTLDSLVRLCSSFLCSNSNERLSQSSIVRTPSRSNLFMIATRYRTEGRGASPVSKMAADMTSGDMLRSHVVIMYLICGVAG